MEVQQLRHLLAAVQYGNLVKASEECHISQSGLSRSIKSLEHRLGVPLLIRSAAGVEPTVYGLSILERARVIMSEVARSVDEIKEIRSGRSGVVTLAVTHNFAHQLIPDLIPLFATNKWNIRMQVTVVSFPKLVDLVKTGEVDFGLGLLAALDSAADLVIEEVGLFHSRIVGRSAHPLAEVKDVPLRRLVAAKWAMLDSPSLQAKFQAFFEARGKAAPTQVLRTNSVVALKKVLSVMDVLSVLPTDMVRDELAAGELVTIDAEPPSQQARAGLVFRPNTYITPVMRSLIEEIRRRASNAVADPLRFEALRA